jgi:hypothetical protein
MAVCLFIEGSLTCNVLAGKIMFRDVVFISHDYTVRVQDGWLIFRWWRAYVPKDVSEGEIGHMCSAGGGTELQGHGLKVLTSQVILFISLVVNT